CKIQVQMVAVRFVRFGPQHRAEYSAGSLVHAPQKLAFRVISSIDWTGVVQRACIAASGLVAFGLCLPVTGRLTPASEDLYGSSVGGHECRNIQRVGELVFAWTAGGGADPFSARVCRGNDDAPDWRSQQLISHRLHRLGDPLMKLGGDTAVNQRRGAQLDAGNALQDDRRRRSALAVADRF